VKHNAQARDAEPPHPVPLSLSIRMEINAGGVDLEQRIVQTTTLRLKK